MRGANRNKQPFWYALCVDIEREYDENGNECGAHAVYATPVKARANISPVGGAAVAQAFGIDDQYDRVMLIDDIDIPIDESTVLWIESNPGWAPWTTETGEQMRTNLYKPIYFVQNAGEAENVYPYDYIVRRVARGLPKFGGVLVAVDKVSVT